MSTPRTIITGALRGLGRIGRGRSMSADQASDGLEILNQMIASLNGQNLLLPYRTVETLTYSSSASSYTIGSGGDLNTVRPIQILDAYHTVGGLDYSMEIMDFRRYNDITNKSISTYPERLYYEPVYPLGKIYYDYQPGTSYSLVLTSMKEIGAFASLDTSISLPSEYDKFMKFNLMVDLCPDYGMQIPDAVMVGATESKQALKRISAANRATTLNSDLGLRSVGQYNINSDSYER